MWEINRRIKWEKIEGEWKLKEENEKYLLQTTIEEPQSSVISDMYENPRDTIEGILTLNNGPLLDTEL